MPPSREQHDLGSGWILVVTATDDDEDGGGSRRSYALTRDGTDGELLLADEDPYSAYARLLYQVDGLSVGLRAWVDRILRLEQEAPTRARYRGRHGRRPGEGAPVAEDDEASL